MSVSKSELELALYAELGEFFDRYQRWFLHTPEHQALATRLALVAARFRKDAKEDL